MSLRSLNIEFAPFSWRRWLSHLPVISWTLLLCAAGLCILLFVTLEPLFEEQKALVVSTDKAQSINRRLLAQQKSSKTAASTLMAQPGAREMVDRLNEPWPVLLDTIEQSIPSGMALLSLDMDSKTRLLKIVAEAKNLESMFESLELLQSDPVLTDVNLVQQEINDQDPNRPVRFHIEVKAGR